MARQRFLPKHKGKHTEVAPHMPDEMPELAALIGRCVSNWSGVELHLALALGSMLGVDNPASVAVFLSLRNHRAQRDALQAAADKTLSPEMKELFGAILNIHKDLDSQRNHVVHGVWGRSDDLPDTGIWSSLHDHAHMILQAYHSERGLPLPDIVGHMTRDYWTYSYEDLAKLCAQIRALTHAIANFHGRLRYGTELAGETAYRQLCAGPLIRRELAQMRSSDKSKPATPQKSRRSVRRGSRKP